MPDPTTTLEVLRSARVLLTEREHWTTGCFCRDENDGEAYPGSTRAVKFCALGAIEHLYTAEVLHDVTHPAFNNRLGLVRNAFRALGEALPAEAQTLHMVAWYNDAPSTSHADILALYDRAIATLEQTDD